jgi:hypothetical protein
MKQCIKCGYKSPKVKKFFSRELCEFCRHFAPEGERDFKIYVQEKTNWRDIQTYRKQNKLGGIRQKRGMEEKAKEGHIMSRAPFGYKIINNRLIPAENSYLVEQIYEEFLNNKISLNRLSRKYGFSVNGLKKILTNFTYIGKIKFGGAIYKGKHKPIVSTTLFNHAQDKVEKISHKKKRKNKNNTLSEQTNHP